jgi:hypothetical protein
MLKDAAQNCNGQNGRACGETQPQTQYFENDINILYYFWGDFEQLSKMLP